MKKKPTPGRSLCPVTYALEIFGDRWTLLILRDVLLDGRFRFKDLSEANPGLATNVLADRLKRLTGRELIRKERDPADARQFLYKPTEQALAILPMLLEMIVWSARQGRADVTPEILSRYETDRDGLLHDLTEEVRKRIA